MSTRTIRTAIGVPLAAALALTTACLPGGANNSDGSAATPSAANGIDELSPTDAFKRASAATLSARSVRVRAKVKDAQAGTIDLDVTYVGRDRARGTMRIGDQRVEIIQIGKEEYQKGNKAFLKETAGSEAVSFLSGKWTKTTQSGSGFGALSGLGDLRGLLTEMEEAGLQGWTMGKPGKTAGTPSVPMTGAGEQIHLAAQGPPYILRMTDGTDHFDFLSYDKPVTIKPPPARLVVE
ncbi:hypothetical protein E1200_28075 [Actinomadura sp. GC306]|uniref:hypothetical protein n=1 Tax=Actinomadura sp. GC306 TaxID=2530367 RepID=UPI00104A274F|nr:hypothetical protein [Actinomadura sp. GC306]TDC61796.1 hypothetical protein E1200_28075 [Actinomadura sp. GC306]